MKLIEKNSKTEQSVELINYNFEGLSSNFNEQLAAEYNNIKRNTIPHHLNIDMIRLNTLKPLLEYTNIARHKSYRWIIKFTSFKLNILQKTIKLLERHKVKK